MSIMSILKKVSSHRKIYIKEGRERESREESKSDIFDIALFYA